MALIKKYNAGGKTDSLNDFKQYVNNTNNHFVHIY